MQKEGKLASKKRESISKELDQIRCAVVEKEPEHFSKEDIVRGFFGALFFGFSFAFSKLVVDVGNVLTWAHVWIILLSTFVILTLEIYFIGYERVPNKKERLFGQFWLKRIITFYLIAYVVSFFLVYVFGIYLLAGANVLKIIIAISMPCSIGAAMADLLKKY